MVTKSREPQDYDSNKPQFSDKSELAIVKTSFFIANPT